MYYSRFGGGVPPRFGGGVRGYDIDDFPDDFGYDISDDTSGEENTVGCYPCGISGPRRRLHSGGNPRAIPAFGSMDGMMGRSMGRVMGAMGVLDVGGAGMGRFGPPRVGGGIPPMRGGPPHRGRRGRRGGPHPRSPL